LFTADALLTLAVQNRVPTIHTVQESPEAGGVMSLPFATD
jgi:hypothetical protein